MKKRPSIPYEDASSGNAAIAELQNILGKFGCQSFGTMTDVERGCMMVQFKWRGRNISLEASWNGYAAAYLRVHPWNSARRYGQVAYRERALAQAKISVCSILRDWVKGQVTAIECGVMSFEAAFMPHILLPSGERLIDVVEARILSLAPPEKKP